MHVGATSITGNAATDCCSSRFAMGSSILTSTLSTGKPIKTNAKSLPLTALQLLSTTPSCLTVPTSEHPESVKFEHMSKAMHCYIMALRPDCKLKSHGSCPTSAPACSYDTVSHKPSQPMSRNSCCSRPWQTWHSTQSLLLLHFEESLFLCLFALLHSLVIPACGMLLSQRHCASSIVVARLSPVMKQCSGSRSCSVIQISLIQD